ncbi:cytochrome c oxidase subunit 4 isoform 1, mitochondrial-like [Paramacrobiotus metropolitanus]|uniref:cytochrome c oxidase subunit 4 isoform 1, mitochondrial-like n=1 Tax=Paramacrobiotus metropolitanus TaxID=2943436 RepID=UPI00244640FF|nr:cytochrome c oxidase subunit 4 isoform 1, mitochondrial-like [Paramacrobiotus metropolitanus]
MTSLHFLRAVPQQVQRFSSVVFLRHTRLASHAATLQHPSGEVCVEDQHAHHPFVPPYREFIGNREIVGYGWAGVPTYGDSYIWPYPAVRFREPDGRYRELVNKEKGDWHKLTKEEKKELYRYNYCETFAEFSAPLGYWRSMVGIFFFWISLALWLFILQKKIYPPLPDSFSDENRLKMLKYMIDMRVGAIDGIGSKWDYEKGRWKE